MESAVFPVLVDPDEVAAFRAALGFVAGELPEVPPTFPVWFLAAPAARGALDALLVASPGRVPIHLAQSFDYHRPLRPGESLTCGLDFDFDPKQAGRVVLVLRLRSANELVCEATSDIALVDPSTRQGGST